MEDLKLVKEKLQAFMKRYYLNELLKGAILFISLWLLYLILVLLIEHFLWLSTTGRSLLFWLFIGVSAAMFYKFVFIPLARLFRLYKGLSLSEASVLIGNRFPEVKDKLINLLQLENSEDRSELLLAGIAQKSRELKPVPFNLGINFRNSLKYLRIGLLPAAIVLALLLSGNFSVFSESYKRVIDYKTAYAPPAPFQFLLNQDEFLVEEGKSLKLEIRTAGKLIPENAMIHYGGERYYLKNTGPGFFEYEFSSVNKDLDFNLSANGVFSDNYRVRVIEVPKLVDFGMVLKFPDYLNRSPETIKGTGNAVIPEGTEVLWELENRTTDAVTFKAGGEKENLVKKGNIFSLSKKIKKAIEYEISTSNSEVQDYETLRYKLGVIKDEYPGISIQQKTDSLEQNQLYFLGEFRDDHGISVLNVVYYTENQEEEAKKIKINSGNSAIGNFFYAFPGDLELEKGRNYHLYFEVYDNDGVNGPKKTKSEVIEFSKLSDKENMEKQLKEQREAIDKISGGLKEMEDSEKDLKELERLQKEKENLGYNDRKKLQQFLDRQKQQNEMMKNYSEKIQNSLKEKNQESASDLKGRLEQNEEKLKENEELRKELEDYADKISKEELSQKLDELSRRNSAQKKSLEQILELTKRYYVQEKMRKLSEDINELGEKQEGLAEEDSAKSPAEQKELSKEFEQIRAEKEKLQKENKGLKKPFELEDTTTEEESIEQDQKKAEEELENNNKEKAGNSQKKAGEKLKQLSAQMKQQQAMSAGEQLQADVESLRRILSNLLVFSFEQEDLLRRFRGIRINSPDYPKELRKQQTLKENFQHIDDSLVVLAMKNPMIGEKITSKITDIEFDIDKALERLSENEVSRGAASQQYVMTNTNELANLLGNVLQNLNESLSPGGGGGGGDLQIPDIIMSQEELNEKMREAMQEGSEGQEKEGNENEGEGKDGESGEKPGEEEMSGRVFEIYKEQQILRKQLEDRLREMGQVLQGSEVLKRMERAERDILEKGFNSQSYRRMQEIQHKLMDLKDALLEQEEESRREATTNDKTFKNKLEEEILNARDYFPSIEILNRQALPLQQIYKSKVNRYFERIED